MKSIKTKAQKGFTLLEILIAALILTLGAVAALGLHVATLKSGIDAKNQSTALQLAADLAALMRSNPTIASHEAGNPYIIDKSGAQTTHVELGSAIGSKRGSPQDIARADIEQWYERAYNSLPEAKVQVCFDANPFGPDGIPQWGCTGGNILYIKIGWSLRDKDVKADVKPGVVVPVGVCDPIDSAATATCRS